ncbi:MAG: hypothetical protein SWY16_27035, partial [Cyanobacteriota bacterium]|nr:hypothetical protein [Cyanobacteriota bacterium]
AARGGFGGWGGEGGEGGEEDGGDEGGEGDGEDEGDGGEKCKIRAFFLVPSSPRPRVTASSLQSMKP